MAKAPQQRPQQKPIPVNTAMPGAPTAQIDDTAGRHTIVRNLCIALALLCLALYGNTIKNGYVLDDVMVLKNNTYVVKGMKAIPELLATPHMQGYMKIPNDLYRPLSLVMFAVEYQFFGANPAVGHFFNIAVFACCVIMLFLFLDKFLNKAQLVTAFIAALLFAVHPIHTEVVANIKSRDELLCFFFAFWSLNWFVKYARDGKPLQVAMGAFTLFLSLISKETAITFIGIIPLIFFFYKNGSRQRSIAISVAAAVPIALFLAIRYAVLNKFDANQPVAVEFIDNALSHAPSVGAKMATEIYILGKYLKLMLVPYPLLCNYSFNSIPFTTFGDPIVLLALAAYVAMAFFAVRSVLRKEKALWAFGVLYFLLTLSLFSNVPFLMGAEMAERFAFFASAGFCMAAAWAVNKWLLETGRDNRITSLKSGKILAVLAPLCLIYGGMAIARNTDWKDNTTLYTKDLEKSPEDSRLSYYLGTSLAENTYEEETDAARKKEVDEESIGHLRKSVELIPNYTEAHVEMGRVFYREGKFDSALLHDQYALQLNPNHVLASNNLGSVYMSLGKYTEAIALFRKSVSLNANFEYAYFNMGKCYEQLKQYDSAIYNFRKVLELNPSYFSVHTELGMIYFFTQKYDSAEAQIKMALAQAPDDANNINNLGAIYLNQKKYPQAVEVFKKAVAANGSYANAYSNLGKAYYFMQQYAPAIDAFNKELAIDPKSARDMPYLALSYKGAGQMDMALKYEAIAKKYYADFKL